jgi:hypothetical protein
MTCVPEVLVGVGAHLSCTPPGVRSNHERGTRQGCACQTGPAGSLAKMRRIFRGALLCGTLGACAGPASIKAGQEPVAAPAPASSPADHPQPSATARSTGAVIPEPAAGQARTRPAALPMDCEQVGSFCLPPRQFVKRLCQDVYAGAALRWFEKSSPFARAYVRSREIKAVNTLGGPASDNNLRFGEEVLILTRSAPPGPEQMQTSGMGGYDVLRWDGTCATLAEGELATRAPGPPRHAPFEWQAIDTSIQNALLADQKIELARRAQRKHCHGISLGRRSAACVEADAKLIECIVAAVRGGISLPEPDRLP